jgi:outer membrane receptor protein involved in Fe transport
MSQLSRARDALVAALALTAPAVAAAQVQPSQDPQHQSQQQAPAASRVQVAGRVTSPAGAPLSDVMVIVRDAAGVARGAQTDGDGRYVIQSLPAGAYTATVRRVGLAELTRPLVVGAGAERADFTLAEQATVIAPMVVSATKEAKRRVEASTTIDVVDGAEVRVTRAAHPSQIMKRVPGVYVSQLSAEGHSMAIRQPISTKPLYLFLEDGVPTRATGFFNHNALYEVNLPQSGGIEVIKGPGTALYGSDAIGGVVNVLTRPAPATPSGEVALEAGAFGYRRLLASGGLTHGGNGVRVDLNVTDQEGRGWREQSPYARQSATVRWDHFGKNGVHVKTVLTGSRVDQNDALALDSARWSARSTVNRSPLSYREARALRLSSAIEQDRGTSLWSVTPYARVNSLGLMPSWQLSYDPQTYASKNNSLGLLARYRRDFEPMRSRVLVGVDVDWSPGAHWAREAKLTRQGTGGSALYQAYTDGAMHYDYDVTYRAGAPYVQAELSPLPKLRVDAGLRYDASGYAYDTRLAPVDTGAHRVPASTTRSYARANPKLGATYELSPEVALFGSYRAGFRAPSQSQLFVQNTALNTLDLKPVKVASWEAGVRGRVGRRLIYQLSAYDMTVRDDIITFITPTNTREATNAGRTSHRGIESSVGLAVRSDLRLDVAYSVTDQQYVTWVPQAARPASGGRPAVAEVRYDGKTIEQAPRDLGNVLLAYSPRLLRGGRVAAEWTHVGRYFTDPQNTHAYAGHETFNLHANVMLPMKTELFARVLNVTDRNVAEVVSYDAFQGQQFTPGMPRVVYAGVRVGR